MNSAPDQSKAAPKDFSGRSDREFEEFLASIGWGSAYPNRLSTADIAEPPQPTLDAAISPEVDKSSHAASPRRTRAAVLRLLIAAVLVVGVVYRNPLQNAITRSWARWAQSAEQRQEVARGMVARAQLLALPRGIDAEGVRDRVGLPAARIRSAREGLQEDWHYTIDTGAVGAKPIHIVVSMSDGKVVDTADASMAQTRLPALFVQQICPQYVGKLRVFCGERVEVLHADAEMATVLLEPTETLAPGLKSTCRVLQSECLFMGQTGDPVAMPAAALYWRGVLYPLPLIQDLPPTALVEDLQWLFKVLGCDASGKIVFSVKDAFRPRTPGKAAGFDGRG